MRLEAYKAYSVYILICINKKKKEVMQFLYKVGILKAYWLSSSYAVACEGRAADGVLFLARSVGCVSSVWMKERLVLSLLTPLLLFLRSIGPSLVSLKEVWEEVVTISGLVRTSSIASYDDYQLVITNRN